MDARGPARPPVPGVIDIAEGENIEVDPPRRLVQTFTALWSDEVKAGRVARHLGDRAGRRLVPADGHPRPARASANRELYGGWPMILSGLKTLLETGELLTTRLAALLAGGGGGRDAPESKAGS